MDTIPRIFVIAAIGIFIYAAFVKSNAGRVNLVALGLACFAAIFL